MSARRKKHEEHEEHVNHERWLITYADMITLLMVLFIVLYAISQVDLAKFGKLKAGLSHNPGSENSAVFDGSTGGQGVLDGGQAALAAAEGASEQELLIAGEKALAQQQAAAVERHGLEQTAAQLGHELATAGLSEAVHLRVEDRGLIVSIATDKVLFAVGRADLAPEGFAVLDRLANPLAALPNAITVEGHTDDVPIRGTFGSNWELSTARATTVLRYLAERHHIPGSRLSAAGYADQHPVASNATAEGRAANRRVELVIRSRSTAPTSDPKGPNVIGVDLADAADKAKGAAALGDDRSDQHDDEHDDQHDQHDTGTDAGHDAKEGSHG